MEKFSSWSEEKHPSRSKRKPKQKRVPQIARLAHDLLNQLSVIQLSGFSLRQRLKKTPEFDLRDLDSMEKAIFEAGELTNALCAELQDTAGEDNARGIEPMAPPSGSRNNVYALRRGTPNASR